MGSGMSGVPKASAGAPRVVASGAGASSAATKALEAKCTGLEGQMQELKLQNDTLEKERLFYFDKLREIEFLLQARQVEQQQSNNLGQDILKILYASEDEKVAIDNEGMLTITAPDGTISASGGPAEKPSTATTGATEAETIEPAQAQEEEAEQEEGDADMEENTA